MAQRDRKTYYLFATLMGIMLIVIVGYGVTTFISPRDSADQTADERAERPTAQTLTLDESSPSDLRILEYAFDPASRQLQGSVMNDSERWYVNIQVEFVYLDVDGDSAGTVRDTTRELAAGETWRFDIFIDEADGVGEVLPGRVQGALRQMEGPAATSPLRDPASRDMPGSNGRN